MENLVNTDKPDLAIASAMKEPIFTELADACLKIVDRDNPNIDPETFPGKGSCSIEVPNLRINMEIRIFQ